MGTVNVLGLHALEFPTERWEEFYVYQIWRPMPQLSEVWKGSEEELVVLMSDSITNAARPQDPTLFSCKLKKKMTVLIISFCNFCILSIDCAYKTFKQLKWHLSVWYILEQNKHLQLTSFWEMNNLILPHCDLVQVKILRCFIYSISYVRASALCLL